MKHIFLLLILLALVACSGGGVETLSDEIIQTAIAQTLAAQPTDTESPTETLTSTNTFQPTFTTSPLPSSTPTIATTPTITPSPTIAPTGTPTSTLDPNFAGTTKKLQYEYNVHKLSAQVVDSKWSYQIGSRRADPGNIYLSLKIVYMNRGGLAKDASAGSFYLLAGDGQSYGWDSFPDPEDRYRCSYILPGNTCSGWWVSQIPDNPSARTDLIFAWFVGWRTYKDYVIMKAPIRP